MRAFSVVLALAVLAICHASPVKKEERNGLPVVYGYKHGDACPAKLFYNDCNQCFCMDDGHSAGCTLMACLPRLENAAVHRSSVNVEKIPHNDAYGLTGECEPNQQFIDVCNVCKCSPDGKTAGCTLMGCPPVEKIRIDGYAQGKKCPAGQTFYDRCNACQCGANGKSAFCTLIACPDDE